MENENQDIGTVTTEEVVTNSDIMAQLLAEYDEEQTKATEKEPVQEVDETDDLEEVTEADGVVEDTEEVEVTTTTEPATENVETTEEKPVQSSKTNEAFKQMRQEVEGYKAKMKEYESYAQVIKEIAEANGSTPEEVIKNYNDRKAEKEAEKQGIPVEVYKEINELKKEVQVLRAKPIEEKFNAQMDGLIKKYSLTDEEVGTFFAQATENGFDLTKVKDIEKVYDFLNVDKVINKKEQERLEQKEKIKKQAPLPPTTTTAVEVDEEAEIEAMLKKRGAWNG